MSDIRQKIDETLTKIKDMIDTGKIDAKTVDEMIEEILG